MNKMNEIFRLPDINDRKPASSRFYRRKAFLLVFVIPNLITMAYLLLIASDRYVSETSLIVYQGNQDNGVQSINLSGGGVSLEGDYLLQAYVKSWDCFSRLDLGRLAASWSQGDFVSRYGGLFDGFRHTPTTLWRYYKGHVTAAVDEETGILKLSVEGYDRRFVKSLADQLLGTSGQAINRLKQQSFANSVSFFRQQLNKDKVKLQEDVSRLSALKKASHIVDPAAAYNAQLGQLNEFNGKLAALNSQIDVVRKSTPNSEQLGNLVSARESLEGKVGGVKQQVAGLLKIVGTYDYIQSLINNDRDALSADETQLRDAQQEVLKNQYFIATISPPNLPPDSTKPDEVFWILTVLGVTFVLYLIVK